MPLTSPERATANRIYQIARQKGLPPGRALELVSAASAESSLDPQAVNKSSGAAGVFQLLSPGYRTRAQQAGGLFDVAANTNAILPDYQTFWKQNPAAPPGLAAARVERSGEGAGFYSRDLGLARTLVNPATPALPAAPAVDAAAPADWTQALRLPAAPRATTGWVQALRTGAPAASSARPQGSWVQALSGRTTPPPPASEPGQLPLAQPRNVTQAPPNYPLATRGKIIGVPYKGTHTLYGNWESDNAIDIAVPEGTPVVALANGTIGPQIGPLNASAPNLAGQRLHLVTAGNEFYYAHLSRILVKPGEKVKAGQVIGYSGSANGVAHLHLGERTGNPLATLAT